MISNNIAEIEGFVFFSSSENRAKSVIDYFYEKNVLPKEILEIAILDNDNEMKGFQKENYKNTFFKSVFINVDLSSNRYSDECYVIKYISFEYFVSNKKRRAD